MCGIVGYIGNDVEDVVISKLKKLEYRGYDSAGIAVGSAEGYKVFKAKGEIKNLEKIIQKSPYADIGIG
ncbi:MAG: glutamine--fructose-6-phosphate aminotransferase, partial [Clostridia bacterium]|nr:glutamine--fructose-6-phosphate aminotransferase [Clostridia bacterium]